MSARDAGQFPHWANRDDIGRFTSRLTSAPETTLPLSEVADETDDGRDPYTFEEYEAMRDERDD